MTSVHVEFAPIASLGHPSYRADALNIGRQNEMEPTMETTSTRPTRRSGGAQPSASLIVLGCLLALAGCESREQQISQREDNLAAAGFIMRPANTPQRQAMLASLPPHRFVRRVHGDEVTYVYADPLVCDCLYVGTQEAYGRFQAYLQQQRLADQQEMTAQTWSNAAWDWGAWGPWGPRYGFVPGPGW